MSVAAVGGIALPAVSDGAVVPVPSGQPVRLMDVITDRPATGLTYRFRFVAPDIAAKNGVMDMDAVQRDMIWLCDTYALPRIASTGPQPNQIVISLSDRPTKFGDPAPKVTQFFEGYSVESNACVWEPF
ncbi:MAG: hypothetical protein KUG69_12610 [Marinosulfonomonas sp.]|nr:hypothetical protein [Marinosulfonomonas sp.]